MDPISLYFAHQPFVTDDEQEMLFLGNGPDCIPDPTTAYEQNFPEDYNQSTGGCIYRARRDPNEGAGAPKFIDPVLIAKPQPIELACQGSSAGDTGKIVGLGEPSMTKDGQLLYFVYMRKTEAGETLRPCDSGDSDPLASGVRCKCADPYEPAGCTLQPCQLLDPIDQVPGTNCVWACDETRKKNDVDCYPWSLLLCKEPTETQPDSADGVDAYEFGIGVARKPHFDVSIGVVQAQ
ncbi:MAG: hypothetical protein KC466_12400 [Myxococcales bacterium]|nr:hypothetical protein [Myxococcales bacterium]